MWEVLVGCLLIIIARICDVSIATIRTIMMIQGRRAIAIGLSVVEVLIWVFVVSQVITEIKAQPIYGVAYAFGFALGTWMGMMVESRLALGHQAVQIITRSGPEMAQALRDAGFIVTQFDGYGRDGPVQSLFIEVARRHVPVVVRRARAIDSRCFYTVDDVRLTSATGSSGSH